LKKLLTGNEAIAEGVIESGVEVVCGSPGTPSTEVIQTFIFYYELPFTGIFFSPFIPAVVGFILCSGTYHSRVKNFYYYNNHVIS